MSKDAMNRVITIFDRKVCFLKLSALKQWFWFHCWDVDLAYNEFSTQEFVV